MKVNRISGAVLVWILACVGSPLVAAEPDGRYVWPLENQTTISSGFCDYRMNHYHGGIDFSTDGREGLPVRAADSGWVMRVSTSYWGYGKAVYLQMTDGRMAVYGHLSEFSDPIQQYVEDNQYRARRYQQNLWPAAGELPVRRGEIIGKTGQTGAGPPHLHFEIRTRDNRPLNPLVYGFPRDDTHAPTISEIAVVPGWPAASGRFSATVDGGLVPKKYAVARSQDGWELDGTPTISGAAGLRIRTHDVLDNPRYSMSTYRCRVYVNDVLFADVRHDSIDYDDTRLINLEREFDGQPGYAERAIQMYRLPGNRLWHYATLTDDGWLQLGKTLLAGRNDIRVEAEDPAGNVLTVRFGMIAVDGPYASSGEGSSADAPALRSPVLSRAEWSLGGLALYFDSSEAPPVLTLDGETGQGIQAIPAPKGGWQLWVPPTTATMSGIAGESVAQAIAARGFQAVTSRDGGAISSQDGHAQIRFEPGDLYYPSFFVLTPTRSVKGMSNARSKAYELGPQGVPFARAAHLGIRTNDPAAASRTALYRYRDRNGEWGFVGDDFDAETGRISGEIDYPGVFAILADHKPPIIRDVTPARGASTRGRRPLIRFVMYDDLAGIGSDEDVSLTIDGDWVPVEYDPDTRQAKARPRKELSPGEHRVEIAVKDRVGNESTYLRILNISR